VCVSTVVTVSKGDKDYHRKNVLVLRSLKLVILVSSILRLFSVTANLTCYAAEGLEPGRSATLNPDGHCYCCYQECGTHEVEICSFYSAEVQSRTQIYV
jgi:hypothetical protein